MKYEKQPHEYSRRVLLVVMGMTPQIVTETLYKLAVRSTPAFVPTEVHLITTKEGANSARPALLGLHDQSGWFARLCDDYDLHGISFDEEMIHIISDTEGQFIDDNQSTEHNRIAADFITDKVRSFTEGDDSALHVSLAGGRKTMSFYAGYALSLYGRWQDSLSHILVNEPFQLNKDFFYPRSVAQRLEINGKYYSTDEANIILSDIPFVRMRYGIPEPLLAGKAGFQQTIEAIQRSFEPPRVCVDISRKAVYLNGQCVKLDDSELALYLWMAKKRVAGSAPLVLDADDFMSEFLEVYGSIVGNHSGPYERAEAVAKERTHAQQKSQFFLPKKSKLNGKINGALGKYAARPFLIQTVEHDGKVAYELGVPAENIEIIRS